MKQEEFEKLIIKGIASLSPKIRQRINNVAICVEKRPSREKLKKSGTRRNCILLGLYEGIPKTSWGRGFGGNLPDKITIFQESVEHFASSPKEIEELVKNVVWHEVAHHFGMNEKEVRKAEVKKEKSRRST